MPIRLVVAHHMPIVRHGLQLLLESRGTVSVVGEASDGIQIDDRAADEPEALRRMSVERRGANGNNRFRLTRREMQIVAAVADGDSNKAIGERLSVTEDTVKHHLSNIFDKVGVFSRLELAMF